MGVADDCCDDLTFLVLTKKGTIIPRSVLRSAEESKEPNQRLQPVDATTSQTLGETEHKADCGGMGLELKTIGDVTETNDIPAFDPITYKGTNFYVKTRANL